MTQRTAQTETGDMELTIPPKAVCFIIMKAREFNAKDVITEPNPGSNPSDDRSTAVLEDHANDSVEEELRRLISNLSVDEQIDLVALMWLGRDDHVTEDWEDVRRDAAEAHNEHTVSYLFGTPLLADYLADGLSILDYSCADYEFGHL